jgi:hypothetical protein
MIFKPMILQPGFKSTNTSIYAELDNHTHRQTNFVDPPQVLDLPAPDMSKLPEQLS